MLTLVSNEIPVQRLWELYEYNPLTGQLWARFNKKYVRGSVSNRNTYIQIRWNGKRTKTNYGRAVYAWCTGAWPTNTIDHINRNSKDNRVNKLRDATYLEQAQNRKSFKGGASQTDNGNWRARVTVDGKRITLGTFLSKAEAQAAYQTALKELL